jgi:hypothetical protein
VVVGLLVREPAKGLPNKKISHRFGEQGKQGRKNGIIFNETRSNLVEIATEMKEPIP